MPCLFFLALADNSGYGLLIVGYSLGGGVATLVMEELLHHQGEESGIPKTVLIRCVTYGAPPVYSCPNGYKNPNLFAFKNHNDVVSKKI